MEFEVSETNLGSSGLPDDILLEDGSSAGEMNVETLEDSRASEVSGDFLRS